MLRTIVVVLALPLITIPCAVAVLIVTTFSSKTGTIDAISRFWAGTLLRIAGVRLRTEGTGKIRPDDRYVLVANHCSYFDILCIYAAIPQPIRFMAKVSLFKIPI